MSNLKEMLVSEKAILSEIKTDSYDTVVLGTKYWSWGVVFVRALELLETSVKSGSDDILVPNLVRLKSSARKLYTQIPVETMPKYPILQQTLIGLKTLMELQRGDVDGSLAPLISDLLLEYKRLLRLQS